MSSLPPGAPLTPAQPLEQGRMDGEPGSSSARRENPPRGGPAPAWFRIRFFIIALAVFALDQITKGVIQGLSERTSIVVIPHFFRLVHVENAGAAFGLFQASPSPLKSLFLIGFSLAALVVVFLLLWRHSQTTRTGWALALIFGGACGNLFGRVLRGSVVDFLLFNLGRYEWPAFNIADSAICIGAALLVWEILRGQNAATASLQEPSHPGA